MNEKANEKKIICPECHKPISDLKQEGKWYCEGCEGFFDEDDLEKVYECNSCGETFKREDSADGDSNKCPSCSKFSSISIENGCPDCDDQDCEKVQAYHCEKCFTYFKVDEVDNKGGKEQ